MLQKSFLQKNAIKIIFIFLRLLPVLKNRQFIKLELQLSLSWLWAFKAVQLPLPSRLVQQNIAIKASKIREQVKFAENLLHKKFEQIQQLKSAILSKELQSSEAA